MEDSNSNVVLLAVPQWRTRAQLMDEFEISARTFSRRVASGAILRQHNDSGWHYRVASGATVAAPASSLATGAMATGAIDGAPHSAPVGPSCGVATGATDLAPGATVAAPASSLATGAMATGAMATGATLASLVESIAVLTSQVEGLRAELADERAEVARLRVEVVEVNGHFLEAVQICDSLLRESGR